MRIVVLATLFAITACSEDAAVISEVKKTEAERKVEYGPWELRQHITLLGEPIEGAFVSRREAWLKAGDDILATCVMTGDARMDESGNPLEVSPRHSRQAETVAFIQPLVQALGFTPLKSGPLHHELPIPNEVWCW